MNWSGYNNSLVRRDELLLISLFSRVIVAYPDRLTGFGFKTLEEFFKSHGTEIIMINKKRNRRRRS